MIKICDFGISKYLNYYKLTKTLIGTPYFISPEQYKNQSGVADVVLESFTGKYEIKKAYVS